MKNFLKKFLFFIALPTSLFSLFLCLSTSITNNYKIDNTISDLVIGDSHIKYSIDESKINNPKIINCAIPGESYYFSFFKLKHLIGQNPNIKRVYLGVGYHNLSNLFDKFTNGDRAYHYGAPYFFILPLKEKLNLIKWSLNDEMGLLKNIIKSGYTTTISNTPSFIGDGFQINLETREPTKKDVDFRINDQYFLAQNLRDFSSLNVSFLEKIIYFLKDNNIELVILKTPSSPYYMSKVPLQYKNYYDRLLKQHNLKIIDFKELKLKSNKYFLPDGDHLNNEGAQLVTQEFKNKLSSN